MTHLLALVSLFLCLQGASAQGWQALDGSMSRIGLFRTAVVRSEEEWLALWGQHTLGTKETLPPVDFAREMVVAVFLGQVPRGGTLVSLHPVPAAPLEPDLIRRLPDADRPGSSLTVFYRVKEPPAGAPVIAVVSRPFAILKVPRVEEVHFEPDGVLAAQAARKVPLGLGSSSPPALPGTLTDPGFDGRKPALVLPAVIFPGSQGAKRGRGKELYVSWGYNKDWHTRGDIHVSQPGLGNDFTLHGVRAHDDPAWTDADFWPVTVPQYSVRVGYFFDEAQDWAVELNFDHAKYTVLQDQTVRRTGIVGGQPVDGPVTLTDDVFKYRLNNGANFLLLNVVRRLPLVGEAGSPGSLAALAKAGVGVMIPHTDNTVFGQRNAPGFQFGGFDTGIEAGLRYYTPLEPLYLELTDKVNYARYRDIQVHQGRADHSFLSNLVVLGLGTSVRLN